MIEPEEIKFTVDTQGRECTFVKFRANNEVFSDQNAPILNYKCGGSGKTFKNPKKGTLRLNTDLKSDDPLTAETIVAWWIGPCKHEMIMGVVCTTCAMSMVGTGFVEDKQRGQAPYVSSVHNVPALVVSIDKAKEMSDANQRQLLNNKKLILLVDLDQTLIHTTNKPPRPNEVKQDIQGFQLFNVFYYTKIRPYAYKFLEKISKLFELHVVTYGQRVYAEQIVRFLDPEKKYFASRVLSRDELISANSKSVNLQALFPSGSQLVMMIDDRPDVWENSDALVWIKPYRYFTEVGDINAVNVDKGGDSPVDEETKKVAEEPGSNGTTSESPDDQVPQTSAEPPKVKNDTSSDNDDILVNVERILHDVHQAFFEHYEKEKNILSASEFAADIRKNVLADEVIVFSGIIRLNTDPKLNPLYQCCVRFGARVEDEITEQTTTLIAVKAQTDKYHLAKKRGIPIVTHKWIEECMAYWKKVDKSKFSLQVTSEYNQAIHNAFSHMDSLSKSALTEMNDEVDKELADLSDESEEDDDDLAPSFKKQKV